MCMLFLFNYPVGANVLSSIELERERCLEENFQSDYTMSQCNYSATEKCEVEIIKLLNKMQKNNKKNDFSRILKAQKKWENYIKISDSILNNLENKYSLENQLLYSNIKYSNYKGRLSELFVIDEILSNQK